MALSANHMMPGLRSGLKNAHSSLPKVDPTHRDTTMNSFRNLGRIAVCVIATGMCNGLCAEEGKPGPQQGTAVQVAQQRAPQSPAKPPAAAPHAPAAATDQGPQRTETIVYDSWTVTCREGGNVKRTCSTTLQLIDQEKRQVLLSWIMGRTAEGTLMTFLQTPTGVQIQKGVELKVENSAIRKLNYILCEPGRCEASTAMDDSMVREVTAGSNATATIYATDGRGISFNIPIKGAGKAIAALQ
jgi:invasion protein IalB